jgi:uncharacterized protein (DUF1501 family)
MSKQLNRRSFATEALRNATGIAIGSQLPLIWQNSLAAASAQDTSTERVLVVVQLSGGNDGLNTIIPYSDPAYYKARPKLGIAKDQLIKIDDSVGMHPALREFDQLMSQQRVSIIQGVGYANPNRSHFESMDIWHTCTRKETRSNEGWLGRLFVQSKLVDGDSPGLHLGNEVLPIALSARGLQIPSIASVEEMRLKLDNRQRNSATDPAMLEQARQAETDSNLLGFVSTSTQVAMQASQRISRALALPDASADFPQTALGEKLKIVSRLIVAGLSTRVYYVSLDGFDTHANQPQAHQGLLKQWADALAAFHRRIARDGQSDRVLVVSFSEFGRRLSENASEGTDHGAAAPMFFSGPKLANWQIGEMPSLQDLDDGDIKFHTDFRRVYATILEQWLKQPSQIPLAGQYQPLPNVFGS